MHKLASESGGEWSDDGDARSRDEECYHVYFNVVDGMTGG